MKPCMARTRPGCTTPGPTGRWTGSEVGEEAVHGFRAQEVAASRGAGAADKLQVIGKYGLRGSGAVAAPCRSTFRRQPIRQCIGFHESGFPDPFSPTKIVARVKSSPWSRTWATRARTPGHRPRSRRWAGSSANRLIGKLSGGMLLSCRQLSLSSPTQRGPNEDQEVARKIEGTFPGTHRPTNTANHFSHPPPIKPSRKPVVHRTSRRCP